MSTLPDNLSLPAIAEQTRSRGLAGHFGRWHEYLELTKPKVSLLIVFTALVGMVLAVPGWVPLRALLFGTLGLARLQILLYTILLTLTTLLPVLSGLSGLIYLLAALVLNARFLYYAIVLKRDGEARPVLAMRTFRYSITYLMWLFAALIADHYLHVAV